MPTVRHVRTNFIQFRDSLAFWCGNEAYCCTPKAVLAVVSLTESIYIYFWQDQIGCAVQPFSFPQDCYIDPNPKTQQDKSHLSLRRLHVLPGSRKDVFTIFHFQVSFSLFHDLNGLPTALKGKGKSQHGFLLAININESYRPVLSCFIYDEKHPQSKNFLSWCGSRISVWVALGCVIGNHNHLKVQFGSAMPDQAARSFLCADKRRCHLAVEGQNKALNFSCTSSNGVGDFTTGAPATTTTTIATERWRTLQLNCWHDLFNALACCSRTILERKPTRENM